MEFCVALTIDSFTMGEKKAQSKSKLVTELFNNINDFIKNNDYGSDIYKYLIILYIVNPPEGYEHLFKEFKPKYVDYKKINNKLLNESSEIIKHFDYSLKIDGSCYDDFVDSSDEESKKILAKKILESLENLDKLPKKVKDFDKERFKQDMEHFFQEQNLL